MLSKNHILLIFEGASSEIKTFNSFKKYYIEDETKILIAIYGTTIYSLFKEIYKDPDLELFSLLKEKNKELLSEIKRDNVSEIHLFFDYDIHASNADEAKLQLMLEYFNEETENGKLYISYPMVEAIRHNDKEIDFFELTVECNSMYKNLVHTQTKDEYKNIENWEKNFWDYVCKMHLVKLGYILNGDKEIPNKHVLQDEIYFKQYEKYITPFNKVSVLSAFPLFLANYYGYKKVCEKLI